MSTIAIVATFAPSESFGGPARIFHMRRVLEAAGATSVVAYVTHGVLSAGATARIAASALEKLVITDTICATVAVRVTENIRVLSVASLIGEAIRRISSETSVSSLFD